MTLTELASEQPAVVLACAGGLIGLVFGATLYRTQFCIMGAFSDWFNFGDQRRFRAWMLAIAVALAITHLGVVNGWVDLAQSAYLAPRINFGGAILGGLLFGFGMVLAGGCVSRNLARMGGGDVRSAVIVLVTGSAAAVSLGGLLGAPRAGFQAMSAVTIEAGSQNLLTVLGVAPGSTLTWFAACLVLALLAYCFSDAAFRRSPRHLLAGALVGGCVAAAWMVTTLCYDEFALEPALPRALTFVRPASDALNYFEQFTGEAIPGFAVATVIGTFLGALLYALITREFRWQGFTDSSDTTRNLAGSVLMGLGGVTAGGCTIGHGVSGVSTLAVDSLIMIIALGLGARMGFAWLERQL